MRPEIDYLLDIRNASETIQKWIANMPEESFYESDLYQSAVLFQLMIIGEASSKISAEIKILHPEIDWSSIIGFRHIIAHAYFKLSLPIVWNSALIDTAHLRIAIDAIISNERSADAADTDES